MLNSLKLKPGSKPSKQINYKEKVSVEYNNKKYLVITIPTKINGEIKNIPVVIDNDDYDKIKNIRWHRTGKYISFGEIYLHQFIMNHQFDGKLYVDHINRICQDNRKENLRLATQTEQNYNQCKRKRNVEVPENCGFNADDIPTNIDYIHSSNCFEIVIKMNGIKVFRKKTTKSKKVTLIAKDIIENLKVEHPEYFENRCLNGELFENGKKLYTSHFEILKLAKVIDPIHTLV